MYKTPEKIPTKGSGVNGKLIYKYTFADQFIPYFEMWMKERKRRGIDSEWLFVVNRDGEWDRAEICNIDGWANTIRKYLGVPFYFHAMRHFWVTNLKRQNLPDDVIMKLGGWSSIEMVSNVYSDLDIEEELGNYFDEKGIKSDIKSINQLKK